MIFATIQATLTIALTRALFGLYAACVDFLLIVAHFLGITYRDANALLFFVLWPSVTILLATIVIKQRREINALTSKSSYLTPSDVGQVSKY